MSDFTLDHRQPVLADEIPGSIARDIALIVAGALFTALLAQITVSVPGSPVPITGQTLAVGLVGATLGMSRGAASLALYAVLGLFLPFYADGASGWSVIWGASGGYIVGFIFAAGAIGWFAQHGGDRRIISTFMGFVVGQLIIFAFGLVGLQLATGEDWGWVVHNGFTIFIVGGLIKAAVGAVVLPSAWLLVDRIDGPRPD
ncbi:MAG: biotin transporter BioY [Solirubrobacteraceae bacterium]|nr:biotin transporter BioY [Solirubrobacteraceae bacterium]